MMKIVFTEQDITKMINDAVKKVLNEAQDNGVGTLADVNEALKLINSLYPKELIVFKNDRSGYNGYVVRKLIRVVTGIMADNHEGWFLSSTKYFEGAYHMIGEKLINNGWKRDDTACREEIQNGFRRSYTKNGVVISLRPNNVNEWSLEELEGQPERNACRYAGMDIDNFDEDEHVYFDYLNISITMK